MAVEEAKGDASLTRSEVNRAKASFELDLVAFFKALQDEVAGELEAGIKEGLSADEVIERALAVFEE